MDRPQPPSTNQTVDCRVQFQWTHLQKNSSTQGSGSTVEAGAEDSTSQRFKKLAMGLCLPLMPEATPESLIKLSA